MEAGSLLGTEAELLLLFNSRWTKWAFLSGEEVTVAASGTPSRDVFLKWGRSYSDIFLGSFKKGGYDTTWEPKSMY